MNSGRDLGVRRRALVGAVILAVTGTCLGLSSSLPSEGALGAPRTFVLHGISLSIIEVDLGARFGCPGRYIGLVLQHTSSRRPVWTLRDRGIDDVIGGIKSANMDCRALGGSGAKVDGPIAVTPDQEAHFVTSTLICGASCAGHVVRAFGVRADASRITVYKELSRQGLGIANNQVKFQYPQLTLYRVNSYNECPASWTKLVYRWAKGAGYRLMSSITYTSQNCDGRPAPPEPGQ